MYVIELVEVVVTQTEVMWGKPVYVAGEHALPYVHRGLSYCLYVASVNVGTAIEM
jgi:hypothetical protein